MKNFGISIVLATILTGLSYYTGLHFGWITELNWLEVFAVFTSYSCTYLCVMQSRINYPIGAISVAAYAYLFYTQGLIASAVLNVYLVPTLIYGWYRWGSDTSTRPVTSLLKTGRMWTLAYIAVTAVTYGFCMEIVKLFGGSLPAADAAILTLSILAQFLLDNKRLETWAVWAVVNVLAMYVYFNMGLYLVAFQYVFFLANTLYGFYQWSKTQNNELVIENEWNLKNA